MRNKSGYTLIEVIIVTGLFASLLLLSNFNLARPVRTATISTVLDVFISDVALTRTRAFSGDTQTGTGAAVHGVYIEPNRYTLFRGSSYDAGNSTNFTVNLPSNLTFSQIDVPSSEVIFAPLSAEVVGYDQNMRTLTLTDSVVGLTRTLRFNQYGVVEAVTQ